MQSQLLDADHGLGCGRQRHACITHSLLPCPPPPPQHSEASTHAQRALHAMAYPAAWRHTAVEKARGRVRPNYPDLRLVADSRVVIWLNNHSLSAAVVSELQALITSNSVQACAPVVFVSLI